MVLLLALSGSQTSWKPASKPSGLKDHTSLCACFQREEFTSESVRLSLPLCWFTHPFISYQIGTRQVLCAEGTLRAVGTAITKSSPDLKQLLAPRNLETKGRGSRAMPIWLTSAPSSPRQSQVRVRVSALCAPTRLRTGRRGTVEEQAHLSETRESSWKRCQLNNSPGVTTLS